MTNNAPIEIPTGNNPLFLGGTTFVNNNTITVKSGLLVDGNVDISGTGEIILDSPGGTVADFSVVSGFTATLGPDQVLRRTAAGSDTSSRVIGPGTFINNGRVEGASSALHLNINGPMGGSGTMKNVNITNIHAPGDPGGTAQVPLEGTYEISFFGQLNMDLGGTTAGLEYDQLFSTDPANVFMITPGSTKLNVSFLPGYFPTNGDVFTLVDTSGTITGNFSQVNLPPSPQEQAGSTFPLRKQLPINSLLRWLEISRRMAMSMATTSPAGKRATGAEPSTCKGMPTPTATSMGAIFSSGSGNTDMVFLRCESYQNLRHCCSWLCSYSSEAPEGAAPRHE